MIRVVRLIPLILLLQSCISSRHDTRIPCNDNIRKATLLVPEIRGLGASRSERLYEVIENELSESGANPLYYPREEWNFASKGVIRSDTAFMTKLKAEGVPFVLLVDVMESHSGAKFDYMPPLQVRNRFGPPANDYVPPETNANNTSVSILISIVSTANQKAIYTSVTKTNISPLAFRERNQGEYQINAGSTGMALQKAVRKGIRNLRGKCLSAE